MNLFFYRSGGQMSKINVSVGLHSIWKLHRKICSLAFLEATYHPWLVAPYSWFHCHISYYWFWSSFLPLTGTLWLHWACPIIPDNLPTSKSFNLITSVESLKHVRLHIHWLQVLGHRQLWGTYNRSYCKSLSAIVFAIRLAYTAGPQQTLFYYNIDEMP